jgi:hypothetical protein
MRKLFLPLALALLALAGPAAAAVSNGSYRGKTSQDSKVFAKVKGGKIASLSFGVSVRCNSGSFGTDAVAVKGVKIKAGGAYKVTSKGDSANGKATYVLKGKVTGKRLTGSIEQFFRNGCQTFDLKISAKRR